MEIKEEGSIYTLTGGQTLHFVKSQDGHLIQDGTTNEEILEVLINRMEHLNSKLRSTENNLTITNLKTALYWLNRRHKTRAEQGLTNKEIPHVS